MQPCSREMQAMNSILNHHQQQQSQMANSLHQQDPQQQIQSHGFDPTSSHDDFLDQMLSSLPSCTSWPPSDLSSSAQNPNNKSLPWEPNLNMCPPSFDDQSVMLASKLRHHQISSGGPTSPAAKVLMLQQQLMLSRGLSGGLPSPTGDSGAGDSGLLPLPLSLSSSDDTIDGSSFKSLNPGGDGSVQALYNGFAGSLHASSQTSNQAQHFHHPQGGGTMQAQNYRTPVGGMNQAPASGGSGGGAAAQPRQRVRARRGQATDPHSIAERLRRERIADRMKSLQELVPNANKTDKASMLDEIIDYVKFLQLQVKVLSMSRLGGAAAVAPVVADISSEGGGDCIQPNATAAGGPGVGRPSNGTQTAASSSSNNNDSMTVTEHQVAKLMEEDMGSAMQYLQGKGLCLMPISLATAISTATCHPSPSTRSHLNNTLLPGGPTSPSLSVLSVQSATMGNVVADSSVKDTTSVSKP